MATVSDHKQSSLTAEMLRDALDYNSETGVFRWRNARSFRMKSGDIAGSPSHKKGYRIIRVNFHKYLAHRLAWLYVYGEWPSGGIDHINGSTDDNSIKNLRVGTQQQNNWNATVRDQNTLGMRHIQKRCRRYRVQFLEGKKRIYLKSFSTLEAAVSARNEMAQRLHGTFVPSPDRLDRRPI